MRMTPSVAGMGFYCPACNCLHFVEPVNKMAGNNFECPTFLGDIKVEQDQRGIDLGFPAICHFTIKDGQITYLADSTHALAGQTVPMPGIPARMQSV